MNTKAEELADDVKDLGKDAKVLARDAQAAAEEKAAELSSKCSELLQAALVAARDMPGAAAARTRDAVHTTDDYVHENPWRAVAISAGVGLVLGVLFSRR